MKKLFTCLFFLIIIVGLGGFLIYSYYNNSIYGESLEDQEVSITISDGDSLTGILPTLTEKGLIDNTFFARVYLTLNNVNANIKAGEYSIPLGISFVNLIPILEKGVFKPSLLVTIPEGMRYEDIAELIFKKFDENEEEYIFSKEEFLNISANPDNYTFSSEVSSILEKYKPEGKPLRGLLFPDTYRFDADFSALNVIETLLINLDKKLIENNITESVLMNNQSNLKSIYEVIILASIIEKEAGNDPDRPIVSGIFHNRLEVNYPLQSDITIHFIKNDGDSFISFADTDIDSLYNTYKYSGLTPTPINNPGISSIKASLSPEKTNYFYFIYDESGKLYYAETYEEHIQNVNNYL